MDFVVDLPLSKEMATILVVIDHLTKMADFIPLKVVLTAAQIAELMVWEVFKLHRMPDDVVSDRVVQFTLILVLHRAAPNFLYWGPPLALSGPPFLDMPPSKAASYGDTPVGSLLSRALSVQVQSLAPAAATVL